MVRRRIGLRQRIHAFTPDDLRAWCEGLGQETFVGSSGRVFPRAMKGAPLLRAWLQRLEALGVRYEARHTWRGWEGAALRFENAQGEAVLVTSDAALLALGGAFLGLAWVRMVAGWMCSLRLVWKSRRCAPQIADLWCHGRSIFSTRFAGEPLKQVVLTHGGVSCQGEAMIHGAGH